MRGVNFTAYQKRKALKLWLEEKLPTQKVCMACKCTERSLWRWKALYDGTIESLVPKSCRPKTPHPNSHTKEEVEQIEKLVKKSPHLSYNEMYGIMRQKHAYSRTYCGFYGYIIKHNLRPQKELAKYVPKPYETPEMLGYKWQMDVKHVPTICYTGTVPQKFYQYTMLDEASRERFIYPYMEQSSYSTIDFVKRCINYFGYTPQIIQTDNGVEFTHLKKTKMIHPLDILCTELHIVHKLIRPRTPQHNGKVERSHRNDQERFYNFLNFYSYDDLKIQMKRYLYRSNKIPMQVLGWKSPLQKRLELETQ